MEKELLGKHQRKLVILLLPSIYRKASIPVVAQHKMCKNTENFYKEMKLLLKIPKDLRGKGKSLEKNEKFKSNLQKT